MQLALSRHEEDPAQSAFDTGRTWAPPCTDYFLFFFLYLVVLSRLASTGFASIQRVHDNMSLPNCCWGLGTRHDFPFLPYHMTIRHDNIAW